MNATFSTRREPHCPSCGTPLNPTNFTIRHDCAYCTYCANHTPPHELTMIAAELAHNCQPRDTSMTHGITWYTPQYLPRTTLRLTALTRHALPDDDNPEYDARSIHELATPTGA